MKETNRRSFLKSLVQVTGTGLAVVPLSQSNAQIRALCGLTPPQTPGPFYPGEDLFRPDNDLTTIPGRPRRALGQVIYIRGQVLDAACRPVRNANVEIWQACASGKYNNQRDPNPAPIDPHFKYWGEVFTNDKGEYMFKTIVPGAYPADKNWVRPPHIHFRVSALGYQELITQMYFKGDPRNTQDLILEQIPLSQRDSVVIPFQPSPPGAGPRSMIGVFNLTLRSVRR
jgi:protocatechuate 3,4-dioxygenase beta subunit